MQKSLSFVNMHKFLPSFLFQIKFMHILLVLKVFQPVANETQFYQIFIHTRS